jgi:hypothetical protein
MTAFLGGCATAPFWPDGGMAEAPPAYGSPDPADACPGTPRQMLDCVRKKVSTQFKRYAESRDNIEDYRKAANLTLFGLGGAAGVNAVTKGSKEGLQTLALGAAGLVGLDATLQVDEQHATFAAGGKALQCLMDTDLSFDEMRGLLFGPTARTTNTTGADIQSAANASTDNGFVTADHALAPYVGADFVTQGAGGRYEANLATSTTQAQSTLQSESHRVLTHALGHVQKSRRALAIETDTTVWLVEAYQRETASVEHARNTLDEAVNFRIRVGAKTYDDRARDMLFALNDIRTAVSDRLLYTHKDLEGIYGALKGAMEKAVKPPSPPAGTGGSTSTGTTKPTSAFIARQSDDRVRRFATNVSTAEQDLRKANDYAETYKICIGHAAPPKPANGEQKAGKP